ncbi:MAG: hypothetical protein GY856_45525 [bacterium]|nr:hypothetical protein [bacterium]
MRTGFLESEVLDRARHKRAEIERGHLSGSVPERDTDTEPEYQDWAENVLAQAQAALRESARRRATAAAVSEGTLTTTSQESPGEEAAEVVEYQLSGEGMIHLNGIHGGTGEYLVPPLDLSHAAAFARSESIDPSVLRLLEHVYHVSSQAHMGRPGGVDPKNVGRAGWGVVFHAGESQAVKDALAPLIAHRRTQGGAASTKILEYRPGDDWRDWLARQGITAGEVQPAKVPYYLLLVGDPAKIPYDFQKLLGVEYAVGRLSFESPSDYQRYVESVIDHEISVGVPQARTAVFFAPRQPRDPVTRVTADLLVKPLMDGLPATGGEPAQPGVAERRGFATVRLWGEEATRANLDELLHGRGGHKPPALIFTAAHGLGWSPGHPRQLATQGALLCQDWPGSGPVEKCQCFGAGDLGEDARVHGTIAFLYASYGAGTPAWDVCLSGSGEPPTRMAQEPFVARLPQRLLAHPRGGALAVIGPADRAWGYSIATTAAEPVQPFQNTLDRLLAGCPVGHAVQEFNRRYAALSCNLSAMRKKRVFGARYPDRELAAAWCERNHSRSYVVVGDPAVRLRLEE